MVGTRSVNSWRATSAPSTLDHALIEEHLIV